MALASRRGKTIFFLVLGVSLAGVAVAVGSGWIILNWRHDVKVVLGVFFFGIITAGIILNTTFLLREIRRNEQHDSFINAVTHELKTPITSIRLYLQTLQRREIEEVQRRDFYRLMIEDSDRLMGTVEQVLKAGEVGHRRRLSHLSPLDFGLLVGECVDLARLRHHLPAEAIRFEPAVNHGGSAVVTGDSDYLRTAVSNLLDNAVKYSGEHVDIRVRLEDKDSAKLRLTVQDSGIGIPQSELKRIFRRFYRVQDRPFKVNGTGLGLFIVRAIVRRHGGRVFAQSEGEGKGTAVTLELPRSQA
jgi:two-component system, OmpR family, sensor histidine kinase SenX3